MPSKFADHLGAADAEYGAFDESNLSALVPGIESRVQAAVWAVRLPSLEMLVTQGLEGPSAGIVEGVRRPPLEVLPAQSLVAVDAYVVECSTKTPTQELVSLLVQEGEGEVYVFVPDGDVHMYSEALEQEELPVEVLTESTALQKGTRVACVSGGRHIILVPASAAGSLRPRCQLCGGVGADTVPGLLAESARACFFLERADVPVWKGMSTVGLCEFWHGVPAVVVHSVSALTAGPSRHDATRAYEPLFTAAERGMLAATLRRLVQHGRGATPEGLPLPPAVVCDLARLADAPCCALDLALEDVMSGYSRRELLQLVRVAGDVVAPLLRDGDKAAALAGALAEAMQRDAPDELKVDVAIARALANAGSRCGTQALAQAVSRTAREGLAPVVLAAEAIQQVDGGANLLSVLSPRGCAFEGFESLFE
jgi:hypothetical protein